MGGEFCLVITTRGCEPELYVDCFIGESNVRSECLRHFVVIVIVTVVGL